MDGMIGREGSRGGVDEIAGDLGTSGRVIEGAGLGDGIVLRECRRREGVGEGASC